MAVTIGGLPFIQRNDCRLLCRLQRRRVRTSVASITEITREPSETFYGGYAGAFRDLDGHAWEIAHNPGFGLDEDGNIVLPGM